MRLSTHLHPEFVLTDLQADDRAGVVHELASRLGRELGDSVRIESIEKELLRREQEHTTCMGDGVAVPHATIDGLEDPVLLIARTEEPIAYGPAGVEPVRFFFVLLSPPNREGEHIKLLARICRFVRLRGFLEALRNAEGQDEIAEVVRRTDREHV